MGKLKGFWRAKRGKKFAFWGSGGVELRQDCIKERVLERFSVFVFTGTCPAAETFGLN